MYEMLSSEVNICALKLNTNVWSVGLHAGWEGGGVILNCCLSSFISNFLEQCSRPILALWCLCEQY